MVTEGWQVKGENRKVEKERWRTTNLLIFYRDDISKLPEEVRFGRLLVGGDTDDVGRRRRVREPHRILRKHSRTKRAREDRPKKRDRQEQDISC